MSAAAFRYQVPLLTSDEKTLLDRVPASFAAGLDLLEWWRDASESNCFAERFPLIRKFNRPSMGFGFFDSAVVAGREAQIMGSAQELLFDRTDSGARAAVENAREQFREFALRYMLRTSDFLQPDAWTTTPGDLYGPPAQFWPRGQEAEQRGGFGYSQHYFKLRNDYRIGKFSEREKAAILDLRDVRASYDWLLLRVRIFGFQLSLEPGGTALPSVEVPLGKETRVILAPEFLTIEEQQRGNCIAEYGFGYALLNEDSSSDVIVYGPGRFQAGFQLINFRLLEDGTTWVRTVFVVNRPERILNPGAAFSGLSQAFAKRDSYGPPRSQDQSSALILPDPILSGIGTANLLTGGEAGQAWGISTAALAKAMLVQHFKQHYEMITGALLTWRQVPDWRDEKTIPEWVRLGRNLGLK